MIIRVSRNGLQGLASTQGFPCEIGSGHSPGSSSSREETETYPNIKRLIFWQGRQTINKLNIDRACQMLKSTMERNREGAGRVSEGVAVLSRVIRNAQKCTK